MKPSQTLQIGLDVILKGKLLMEAFALLARSPYFLFLVYIRLDQTQQNRDIMVSCVFIPNTDLELF